MKKVTVQLKKQKLIDQTIDRFKRQKLLKEKVADELKVEIQEHRNSTFHQKYKNKVSPK